MERFWSKVSKTEEDSCWEWTSSINDSGYGEFSYEYKTIKAHRFSFFLEHGRWPEPCCLHTCDNRKCVNPKHLVEGTHKDNMDDMNEKGRGSYKRNFNTNLKITDNQVCNLIAEYLLCKVTQLELASKYGISRSQVNRIILRKGRLLIWD